MTDILRKASIEREKLNIAGYDMDVICIDTLSPDELLAIEIDMLGKPLVVGRITNMGKVIV
jgi:hypothetical protein